MDETAAQTPRLVPIDTAPASYGRGHRGGYPPPSTLPAIQLLARDLTALLAESPVPDPPGRFRVSDVAAALDLGTDHQLLDLLPLALVFAGHGPVVTDPGHGLLVTLQPPAGVAGLDDLVAETARAAGDPVTVRSVCRLRPPGVRAGRAVRGLSSWLVRGALLRLEAAGRLVRDPGCRWLVTTRWLLAPDSTSV